MQRGKNTLKVEYFHNDKDIELQVSSKREILSILRSMADQGAQIALFYGGGQKFILSTLLGVERHGMWLDVGQSPAENKRFVLGNRAIFVGFHQGVKIQFTANNIESDLFEGNEAFYLGMPDYLLRIQRRENFRISIPSVPPVTCTIPIQPENPDDPVIMRKVPVVDICGGGIGLLCEKDEATLLPQNIFPECKLSIPGVGILTVTIEIRDGIDFITPYRVAYKRLGCQFIDLDNQASILLQRYITQLQSESRRQIKQ